MKILPKQYAILLYELTKDAKESDLQEISKSFLNLLVKNRDLSLLPRIERLYCEYYNKQEGVVDVEVTTAQEISKNAVLTIKELVKAKNLNIQMKVDKNVIGGAAIKVGDYLVDDTLQSRLSHLKHSLTD